MASVTFTAKAGNELLPHFRDKFTIGFKAPDTPGEYLFFKTVQTCVEGETAWIEEYTGEGEEPEHPSPAMLVTESTGDEHGGAAEEAAADPAAADEAATAADTEEDDDSDSGSGIAIAALVIGLIALGGAGYAVSRTRKPGTPAD